MSATLRIFLVICSVCCAVQLITAKPTSADLADIKDFPFMAAILDDDLDEFLGMAVIVSKNVIFSEEITAPVGELRIRVGSADWTRGGKVVKAKEIVDFHYYDLVILAEDLEFTDCIQPVAFSGDAKEVTPEMPMKTVGWGYETAKQETNSKELMVIPSQVLSENACHQAYPDIFDEVPDTIPMFCLSHPHGPGVFDESESVALSGNTLHGFGVYRDITEKQDNPALFVHFSIFQKKIRKTIKNYS